MSIFKMNEYDAVNPLRVSSIEFRDGQQSLLATRVKTADMLPILAKMDQIGYESMEMWGGATFDACIRYLDEDPWDRVRDFKSVMQHTPLRMLLRGQNLVGYVQYPDDVVELFVEKAADAGIDIFLVFDGLNDIRNCETAVKAALKAGKAAEANILYTTSPVHSIEQYVQLAKAYEAMGVQAIHFEDMAGLLTPEVAYKAIKAIKGAIRIPLHIHCHCTGGMADLAYWEAIRAGVDVVDLGVSALSLGTAHPPLESFVVALNGTIRDTGLNLALISDVNQYFLGLRNKYHQYESMFTGVDISVLQHQVPGGMLSNLESQLKQMEVYDRLDEVLAEVHQVRADFGYPPLGTPFSQMVGAQATMNVLLGERYKMLSNESREYIRGMYGNPPGPINPQLVANVLGETGRITCRPADLLQPGIDSLRTEAGALVRNDEDLLTYAMFPLVGAEYLKKKYNL